MAALRSNPEGVERDQIGGYIHTYLSLHQMFEDVRAILKNTIFALLFYNALLEFRRHCIDID